MLSFRSAGGRNWPATASIANGRCGSDVIGVAAVREHAKALHRAAQILFAAPARAAAAAADPRMRKHARSHLDAFGFRPDRYDLADILMPERKRQLHATFGQTQAFAAAEIEIAICQMQIAMADARREHLEQYLRALWLRGQLFVASQRLAAHAKLAFRRCRGLSALWSRSFSRAERTGDQHDAYSPAWLCRADQDGSLAAFLKPALTPPERAVAQVEGWILGAV